MRDPFRPNSNSQLIREAQFAFVVIAALLCVLVYLTFHRMSGRKFHFRQIAQTAPLAQHIDDTAYPAQTMLDQEAQIVQETLNTIRSVAQPTPQNLTNQPPTTVLKQSSSPRRQPAATSTKQISPPKILAPPTPPLQRLPVDQAAIAASAPALPTPNVAQAQFIAPTNSQPVFKPVPQEESPAPKPIVDDPFENIKSDPSWSTPAPQPSDTTGSKARHSGIQKSKPIVADDTQSDFQPPTIKSNFGAGSTRELPSFDAPIKNEPFQESKNPVPTQLRPAMPKPHDSGSTIQPKTTPIFAKSFTNEKEFAAKSAEKKFENPKPEKPRIRRSNKQKSLGPPEYQVRETDSLWSIAVDHYGDGRFFRALHQHNLNRIASADRLEPNTSIVVPSVDVLIKRHPKLCPVDKLSDNGGSLDDQNDSKVDYDQYEESMGKRFHITQDGDTLFDVARQRLGQASRYLEIFELNRFRIPRHVNHLTPLDPGLRLLLPE